MKATEYFVKSKNTSNGGTDKRIVGLVGDDSKSSILDNDSLSNLNAGGDYNVNNETAKSSYGTVVEA